MLALLATPTLAQMHPERITELDEQVTALTEQLGELKAEMDEAKEAGKIESIKNDVEANKVAIRATQSSASWTDATSVTHLSGCASADYVSVENGPAAFATNFNPMFHFLYDNKILWEAELEVEVEENDGADLEGDPTRGYSVFGFDANYRWNNLDLRGEYVSEEVDAAERNGAHLASSDRDTVTNY